MKLPSSVCALDGCPILYAVELSSAAQALGLTQDEVDRVVEMSEGA